MPDNTNDIWFFRPKPNPHARVRLLCFAHAGGAATVFKEWPELLGPDLEVVACQLPGIGSRLVDPPYSNLHTLVDDLIDAVTDNFTGAYALFGHSLGALISFELARTLTERGLRRPSHLIVSGCLPPQIKHAAPAISDLPANKFIEAVDTRCKGVPQEGRDNEEMLALVVPGLRAYFKMQEDYRYFNGLKLSCHLTALGGEEDLNLTAAQIQGWQEHTQQDFSCSMLPSGHFFVFEQPRQITRIIKQRITQQDARNHVRI